MPGALAQNILHWQQDHHQAQIDLIRQFAEVETPSDDPQTQGAIYELLRQAIEAIDFQVMFLQGQNAGKQLFARPRSRQRHRPLQLLLGHCDTIWPIGTLHEMPIVTEADVMRGPGVYDMKAGLAQMIFALRALQELGIKPAVTPLIFINSDEEIGSRQSTREIRRLARICNRSLVLEPSLGRSGLIKTARKGVGRFTITAHGKAAHAGLDPESGASAILELSHIIQQLFALNDVEQGITVNVGTIDGGLRANVVAPVSSATADVRVLTHEDAQKIEQAIYGLQPSTPGVTLEIEGLIGRPPMEKTVANRALWKLAKGFAHELDFELEEGTAGGGSDGNTTSQYNATLDGLGAVGDGAHAHHEHIDLSLLPQRSALLCLLLMAPPIE